MNITLKINNKLYFWSKIIKIDKDKQNNSQIKNDYIEKIKEEIYQKYESHCQFFNLHSVISSEHLKIIVYHVDRAFKTKINISNKENIEFLLYLSGLNQINLAIEKVGIHLNDLKEDFGIVIFSKSEDYLKEACKFVFNSMKSFEFRDIPEKNNQEILSFLHDDHIKDENINRIAQLYNFINQTNYTKYNFENIAHHDLIIIANDIINEKIVKLTLSIIKEK